MIPFYKHNLSKDKNYLRDTISGSYLTSGPVGEKVEDLDIFTAEEYAKALMGID